MSAQRREQNGRNCSTSGLPQIGQVLGGGRPHRHYVFIRDEPATEAALCRRRQRVDPAGVDREPFAGQQRHGLVERQAHHVGVGADQLDDERAGDALGRIAAGLAAPLAGGEIGVKVLARRGA